MTIGRKILEVLATIFDWAPERSNPIKSGRHWSVRPDGKLVLFGEVSGEHWAFVPTWERVQDINNELSEFLRVKYPKLRGVEIQEVRVGLTLALNLWQMNELRAEHLERGVDDGNGILIPDFFLAKTGDSCCSPMDEQKTYPLRLWKFSSVNHDLLLTVQPHNLADVIGIQLPQWIGPDPAWVKHKEEDAAGDPSALPEGNPT